MEGGRLADGQLHKRRPCAYIFTTCAARQTRRDKLRPDVMNIDSYLTIDGLLSSPTTNWANDRCQNNKLGLMEEDESHPSEIFMTTQLYSFINSKEIKSIQIIPLTQF